MCTIILAHRILDDTPILVGANRDEQLDRPSRRPQLNTDGPVATICPRDLRAGGTWLGVNARGVVSAITNRFGEPNDADRLTRGELVDRALAHPSAEAASRAIAGLDAANYNAFHLLNVDADQAILVCSDGDQMTLSRLDPGLIVVTERSLGAGKNRRETYVFDHCQTLLDDDDFDEAHLAELLGQRQDGSIDAACVHMPSMNYGTRSSTIIGLGRTRRLLHAEGPPCTTDYEDLSHLIAAMAD